jgi:NTE family protein
MPSPQSPRIALVLGSGGIKCIASIGLLKVLHREQIVPDMIVGSSGGSLFGAVFATGEHPDEIERLVVKMWQKKDFQDIKWFDLIRMFFPKLLRFSESFGLIRGDRIERILCNYFQGQTIEQTKIPLKIVATDVFTGEEVILEHGSIAEAVRASISVPMVLQPKKLAEKMLVDGAVSNPLPVNVAIRYGADLIIAMGFESPTYTRIDSPMKLILQLTALSNNNLLMANQALHNIAHHYEIIMVYPTFSGEFHLTDVARIPELIALGEQEALNELPNIRNAIEHFEG